MQTRISLIFIALLGLLPYISTIKLPPIPSFWAELIAVVIALCWLAALPTNGGAEAADDPRRPAGATRKLRVPVAVAAFAALGAILLLQLLARQPMFRGAPVLTILALVLASLTCQTAAGVRAASQTSRLLDVWSIALLVALLLNLVAVIAERQALHLYVFELGWRPAPERAEGLIGQPNQLAVIAALTSVAAHYLWMRGRLPSMAHGLFGLAVAIVIAATASRAGVLMWSAGAVFSALALRDQARRVIGWRLLLLAAGLIVVAQVVLPLLDTAGAPADAVVAAAARTDARGRIELWRDSWALVKLHPLTGVGYGNFMGARWNELSTSLMEPSANQAHNLIAQLAVELGVVGAALVLVPLGWSLWRCLRVATRRGVAPEQFLAAVIALLIAGYSMVEYPLWYTFFLLPFALALGLVEQPDLLLRVSPCPPALRWMGLGLSGVLCVVLAFDYHRSEELYSSLELQQRAGKNAPVRIPVREATEVSALSAFDLYANLMYSRTLAPDGLFMGYKRQIAERAMLSMTNQETIARQVALMVASDEPNEAMKLLDRTKRDPDLERETRATLQVIAPLHPKLAAFVSALPPQPPAAAR